MFRSGYSTALRLWGVRPRRFSAGVCVGRVLPRNDRVAAMTPAGIDYRRAAASSISDSFTAYDSGWQQMLTLWRLPVRWRPRFGLGRRRERFRRFPRGRLRLFDDSARRDLRGGIGRQDVDTHLAALRLARRRRSRRDVTQLSDVGLDVASSSTWDICTNCRWSAHSRPTL